MQAARSFTLRQTERLVQRLPAPAPADREAHADSRNDTRAEYEELANLINETSQLMATWKRKRGDAETGFEPEPVELVTPTKFARLSESALADMVSTCHAHTIYKLQ